MKEAVLSLRFRAGLDLPSAFLLMADEETVGLTFDCGPLCSDSACAGSPHAISPFRWLRAAGCFAVDFSCSALHCTGFPWLPLSGSRVPAPVEIPLHNSLNSRHLLSPAPGQVTAVPWRAPDCLGRGAGALQTLLVQGLSPLECASPFQLQQPGFHDPSPGHPVGSICFPRL